MAKKSVYVLSNKRAICIIKKFKPYEIVSFTKDKLDEMKKVAFSLSHQLAPHQEK